MYGAISSLSASEYVNGDQKSESNLVLTKEAKASIENGSPEYQLYQSVPSQSEISRDELSQKFDKKTFNVGFSKCMKNKWLIFDKSSNCLKRNENLNENVTDTVAQQLQSIQMKGLDSIQANELKDLKKRKLLKNEFSW